MNEHRPIVGQSRTRGAQTSEKMKAPQKPADGNQAAESAESLIQPKNRHFLAINFDFGICNQTRLKSRPS
jgi:hypothetical protein